VANLLLMAGKHIMRLTFLEYMTMFIDSLSHNACLSSPLTFLSYGCSVDINRMILLSGF